ncbi:hypothetical protein [Trichococcus shcherbakoviae]|uniref:Uncharacterized protein n=1 Tax=Trichococcus shcherbakoviae subsp. psychrophilus TaxID=2585775 RepID=A0A5C5EAT9_9LACT|nr:hypothetical protein [Trichococcus shcherbakoviae]TNV69723.1 hypothetical protein FHK04_00320 [Trichococcus shcherbakoviae subsp. psychrophilus]
MTLKWLEKQPKIKRGINWGTPWEKGKLTKEALQSRGFWLGGTPLQTKALAFWPDGSIKWTGHAGIFDGTSTLTGLTQGEQPEGNIAESRYNGIYIDNGSLKAFFPKHGEGNNLLDWVKMAGEPKLTDLRIEAQYAEETLSSKVTDLVLEENGPLKAVVKVCGCICKGNTELQQFIVRFRFYREVNRLEIVHTLIVIEPKPIEGIGITYQTALTGERWNRHVKFVGESGVYAEPGQLLMSRRFYDDHPQYAKQAAGEIVKLTEADGPMLVHAKENAVWNNFWLTQINHRSYTLKKQTEPGYAPLLIGDGSRSLGSVYAGGETGGVACSIEKFWEKAPSAIEVQDLTGHRTKTIAWLWSPEAGEMDFSHYSSRDHMLSAYEGMEEIRSTAVGVANTTRLWLDICAEPLSNADLFELALENRKPALIVAAPESYHQTKVFGSFSLPNRTDPLTARLEDQMLALRKFYVKEVDSRSWYGYWNYGDVMHTYDRYRHQWRYDLGGYAWQNTELVPNMWLWLDFLRTGDPEVFHFAEAMTRHTSEVDQYHAGEYKGLGSRHNVLHWGCQCKEVRISMAGLHRYYYYLTADERIGEIMEQVKDNETYAFEGLAPMREFYERTEEWVPIRVGPDWSALVSNWFTQWERTGDGTYLEKIKTGLACIKATPDRLLSGPTYLFNPTTKELQYMGTGNEGGYHMVISFGAPQVWLELAQNLEDPELNQMLGEFGWMYSLSPEEKLQAFNGKLSETHFSWPMFGTTMMAYGAVVRDDEAIADRAWKIITTNELSGVPLPVEETLQQTDIWKPTEELPWISTNVVSQWCLNTICCLEWIGGHLTDRS